MSIKVNSRIGGGSIKDFRKTLEILGAKSYEIGDIWVRNDRGAQAICTPEIAGFLDQKIGTVSTVEISCEAVELKQLQLPPQSLIKKYTSVEASKRIDAIAGSE